MDTSLRDTFSGIFVGIILTLLVVAGLTSYFEVEISKEQYAEITVMVKETPALQTAVDYVMFDNKIERREFSDIKYRYDDFVKKAKLKTVFPDPNSSPKIDKKL